MILMCIIVDVVININIINYYLFDSCFFLPFLYWLSLLGPQTSPKHTQKCFNFKTGNSRFLLLNDYSSLHLVYLSSWLIGFVC